MIAAHPALVQEGADPAEEARADLLQQMKNFKTKSTIFEIGNTSKNKDKIEVMARKREKHAGVIEMNSLKQEAKFESLRSEAEVRRKVEGEEAAGEEDIASAFDTIVKDRKEKAVSSGRDKSLRHLRDEANYIPYQPADQHTEAGYSMMTGFAAQARCAVARINKFINK